MNITSKNIEPSFAEKLIIKKLKERKIRYLREYEFNDCRNPSTGAKLRYDFYLPNQNLLIEYDGKDFHSSEDVKIRDSIKTAFARKKNTRLIRISGLQFINSTIDKISIMPCAEHVRKMKATSELRRIANENEMRNKEPITAKSQAEIKKIVLENKNILHLSQS